MPYKVIILYQLYMPSYFLGTFTEYPYLYVEINELVYFINSFYLSFKLLPLTYLLHFCNCSNLCNYLKTYITMD